MSHPTSRLQGPIPLGGAAAVRVLRDAGGQVPAAGALLPPLLPAPLPGDGAPLRLHVRQGQTLHQDHARIRQQRDRQETEEQESNP